MARARRRPATLAAACATPIFRVSSFAAVVSARASFTARALAALPAPLCDSKAGDRASKLSAPRRSSSRDQARASAVGRASARDAFSGTIREVELRVLFLQLREASRLLRARHGALHP